MLCSRQDLSKPKQEPEEKREMIQDVDEIWSTLSHPDADHNAMYAKTVGIKLFTT